MINESHVDVQKTSLTLYSNICQSYLELELYEDALEFADKALMLQENLQENLFRKGKALIFLFEFQKAEEIFKKIGNKE